MAFDPDAYLAEGSGFDPDAYLGETGPQDPLTHMYADTGAKQSARPGTRPSGSRSITTERASAARNAEQAALDKYKQIESGQLSAADLPAEEVEAIRAARINSIPELSGISDKINFGQALAGLSAYDPEEFANIVTASDPEVGYVHTPDGQIILHNNRTGAAMNANKPGPSVMDALQFGSGTAAFTPAGMLSTIPRMAAGGMATQALIEAGQKDAGGEFDPVGVLVAGAAPVVMNKIIQAGKGSIEKIRPTAANQYLQELDDIAAQSQQTPAKEIAKQQSEQLPAKLFEPSSRRAARQGLRDGTVEGVGWKIGRRGRLQPDNLERDLVRSGINDKAVASFNRMSSGDKVSSSKMIDKALAYVKGVAGSEDDLPNRVIGDSMMQRYRDVVKYQRQAGREIGKAVKDSASKKLDAAKFTDDFMDSLEELKVVFNNGAPDFSLSNLANTNTKPIKTILKRLDSSDGSFKDLHEIKQMIYEQVDYGSDPTSALKISDKGQKLLKDLAADINAELRSASKAYEASNDKFKAAAEVVYPFAKAMGSKFNPETDSVERLVGQELRKTLSNYNVGPGMKSAVTNLDAFSRGLGNNYSDDVGNLIILNSELERLGSFKPNSLQGISEKVSDRAADRLGLAAQTAKGVYNEAKDRVLYETPSLETIKTLEKMKQLINRNK